MSGLLAKSISEIAAEASLASLCSNSDAKRRSAFLGQVAARIARHSLFARCTSFRDRVSQASRRNTLQGVVKFL